MDKSIKLLECARGYLNAHKTRNERFISWTTGGIADQVKQILEKIKDLIIDDNDFFKSNLYVYDSYATMESNEKELISKPMRTIVLKSGFILAAGFQSESSKSFSSIQEEGFQIHFNPTLNGKIHVYAYGHNYQDKKAEFKSLELIDDPNSLNEEKIIELVTKGIEFAKSTSFLFIGDKFEDIP